MAEKGSDLTFDFCCNVCGENGVNKQAMFYCQQCLKSLCDDCIGMHTHFFKKHVVYEREQIDKWPVTTKSFEDWRFCEHHNDHLIEMFCEDHNKLCCSMCHFHDHRNCIKLVLLKDKSQVVQDAGEFNKLSAAIADVQQKPETAIDETQEYLKKLQDSYDKAYEEIKVLRKKINDILNELERKTMLSLDNLFQTLNRSLKSDGDICTKTTNGLKKIGDAINKMEHGPKDISFIAYQKALEIISQAENLLEKLTTNRSPLVVCNSNTDIEQTLSCLSFLGRIECVEKQKEKDKVMTLECKSKYGYGVRILSDKNKCIIKGICELPNGDILVADMGNNCVKLFDTQFTIVVHTDLPASLMNMCSISPTEFAVTIEQNYSTMTYTVQLLRVNNNQIVKGRILTFNHRCFGIAHFNGSLFITSFTALYRYKLDGQLVKKIYEDTSRDLTVNICAVSADGSRLYVTNSATSKLQTLSMDGTVLSSLELGWPAGVHVSESGHLLVCDPKSGCAFQVDSEVGLLTMASKKDGLDYPLSVYYSARTGRVIVGQHGDNILVINTL